MKRRRWMAIPGALVATALTLAACVTARIERPAAPVAAGPSIAIQAAPVPLNTTDLSQTGIGGFRYAGGVALTSSETSRLHGLSDLVIYPDGRLLSVSDDGDLLAARLVLDSDGRLTGLSGATLRPLVGPDGQPMQGKSARDAEGLTLTDDGRMLVSFEHEHRIWEYPAVEKGLPSPLGMPGVAMADNDGMEGLVAVAGGYFVGVEPGNIWFCRFRANCTELKDLPGPPPGYRLSSLTTGPRGELVILFHSYIPAIGSRVLVAIVADPMTADDAVDAFPIAPPLTIDNFEGVAVVRKTNGDWRIYLLSDDNFSAAQRTLLLAFDWTPPQ